MIKPLTSAIKLCEQCRKHVATCHIVLSVGGVQQSRNLCDECNRATATPMVQELQNARCKYCGGPSNVGGTDTLARAMGVHSLSFMCFDRSREYRGFMGAKLPELSDKLPQSEQLTAMQKLCDEADEHMKQWLAKKGGK